MAGVREEERQQYNKKHNSFKSRKNSFQGSRRDGSNPPTPSPSTPVSPGPSLPRMLEHVPVNGFNAQEVSEYLDRSYQAVLSTYHDPSTPEHEKPELYKSGEKAWGKGSGLVWAQKGTNMANNQDFLTELRKGLEGLKKG